MRHVARTDTDKPRRPTRNLWDRFRRNRKGSSTIEFALVSIPFLGLLCAIMETGLVFLNGEGLEAAVQEASRNIMTGQAQAAGVSSAASFSSTYLCPTTGPRILPSFIDCSKLIIDVRSADTFANADTSKTFYKDASSQQFCPGGNSKIIVVRVAYPMPVFLPVLGGFIKSFAQVNSGLVNDVPGNAGWKHLLVGTAVFQNEPFQASSYTPPTGCS